MAFFAQTPKIVFRHYQGMADMGTQLFSAPSRMAFLLRSAHFRERRFSDPRGR